MAGLGISPAGRHLRPVAAGACGSASGVSFGVHVQPGSWNVLILPLHRRMTWANAPWVTLALVALNVLVFAFLQGGDDRVRREAAQYYEQARLGEVEFPAYTEWLREHGDDPQRLEWMLKAPGKVGYFLVESDADFQQALQQGRIIDPQREDHDDWRARRDGFERIRDSAFTARHALRYSHVEPGRLFSAMFLHGGVDHLVGNMAFLLMLGLLVEGALGPWRYLALYLAGGIGASAGSLLWRWGEYGLMLGASGAIAALMGAYCVLWGLRKVRVFYWFFLIFDYVRIPALALLPVWLGWEVYNMLASTGSNVAFEAHAAGIVCGTGIALALRRGGWVRRDFIEEDERTQRQEDNDVAYQQALEHVGRLEIDRARHLLEAIDADQPGQLRVLIALYRCARYGGSAAQLDAAAARALHFPVTNGAQVDDLTALYDDYLDACGGAPRIPARSLLPVFDPWLRHGGAAAAEVLLRSLDNDAQDPALLAAAWFKLALQAPEASAERQARLGHLAQRFPRSAQAGKARFLLEQA